MVFTARFLFFSSPLHFYRSLYTATVCRLYDQTHGLVGLKTHNRVSYRHICGKSIDIHIPIIKYIVQCYIILYMRCALRTRTYSSFGCVVGKNAWTIIIIIIIIIVVSYTRLLLTAINIYIYIYIYAYTSYIVRYCQWAFWLVHDVYNI